MKLDRDRLSCAYQLLASPPVSSWALYKVLGYRFWIALLVTATIFDGSIAILYWLVMRAVGRRQRLVAKRHDAVFGEIELNCLGTWEARVLFEQTNEPTLIFIDAPETGPTASQRTLFKEICSRYSSLTSEIHAALVRFIGDSWQGERAPPPRLSRRRSRFQNRPIPPPGAPTS
jgi:hypothetical protein